MKRTLFSFVFLLFSTLLYANEPPKSLVIMLDGVRADALRMVQKMDKAPNIDSLIAGNWAPNYKGAATFAASTIRDAPPDSAPNHAAIATGVIAEKHQIKGNGVYADYNGKRADTIYQNYLTRIQSRYPEKNIAFVYSWEPDSYLTQAENAVVLAINGSDSENAHDIVALLANILVSRTDNAKKCFDDALLWYIDLPDAAGHSGGFSPPGTKHDAYLASIEQCDTWIGNALATIKKRPNFAQEDWQIIICSDHGGWNSGHGAARADNYTVPLIVSGKNVLPGTMPGQPSTADVAVTVLDHFGFDVAELKRRGLLDGNVRKSGTLIEQKRMEEELMVYVSFDNDIANHAEGEGAFELSVNKVPIQSSGGKHAGYFQAQSDYYSYIVLNNHPDDLKLGRENNMSLAFWLRLPKKLESDTILLGNRARTNAAAPGVSLFASGEKNGEGNNLGLTLTDDQGRRMDVKQLYIPAGEWCFCAVTIDCGGNAMLYAGLPDGKLFFCSKSLAGESLGIREWIHGVMNSDAPWTMGVDAPPQPQLSADFDELRIWTRCLALEEIETLFQDGGTNQSKKTPSASR